MDQRTTHPECEKDLEPRNIIIYCNRNPETEVWLYFFPCNMREEQKVVSISDNVAPTVVCKMIRMVLCCI